MRITEAAQSYSFSRRALVLGGLQAGVGMILAARMTWLAVFENDKYRLLADSNRINLTLTPPRRGWILDRHNKPLALNRTSFRVDLIPDRIEDKEAVVQQLKEVLKLTPEEVAKIEIDLKRAAGFQPVQVAENLDWERYAAVSVRLPEMPGVQPTQGYARYYPLAAGVAHLLGYVGAASAEEYRKLKDPLLITPGFKMGKDGLEKVEEDVLRGTPGAKRVEVTARGRLVNELATRPDQPGKNVKLTIDAGLQEYAARRLGPESGSTALIDLHTGGLLALVSMPAYDPNSFSDGISRSEWAMLSGDERIPLMNKALQGLYPPGSTFKPATALAALGGGLDPNKVVYCSGGYTLGNRRFGCLGRHGPMTLHTAIARSCNTYFYTVGREVGPDAIAIAARKLGLGAEYKLPLPSQRYGTVPDPAWMMRRRKTQWSVANTLNMSIGQGDLLVSPLQLAILAARVGSGKALVPQLLADQAKGAEALDFPEEHLAMVRSGMDEVVNGHGTAGRSKLPFPDIRMGGKTGTAQVRRIAGGARGGMNVPWKYRDHGLFVCFAPVENPRYAAAVVIEHGMSGSGAAAPVARDMMTYLFDQTQAMTKLTELETGWGGDYKMRMAKQSEEFRASQAAPPPPPPEDTAGAAEATAAAASNETAQSADTAATRSGEAPE
ncbi:penicillin-binding protein 2 [Sphingomonas sp. AOB5]|uniref:penicillin-binding protein 2 n=1 Tax=Sphingomonas sp. AOB5 TaxID=3034017 RepID=UPI0023F64276|nr:penicillin-binding protein 2 [Sphingomonas sp. AOB5]MDF7774037.1 penicillin-binding protein 2 [Sphingomonas sp. AOB5]